MSAGGTFRQCMHSAREARKAMALIAVIGGTGAALFPIDGECSEEVTDTQWGKPSAPLQQWQQGAHRVVFLARHGPTGSIPPHRVNYRANLVALAGCQPDYVVALNAVGGISAAARPGHLVIPDQLIDYTWGRGHTMYEAGEGALEFVDFTAPYDKELRTGLIGEGRRLGLSLVGEGTYGVTQGPRLETAAEINRLAQDGCSVVGMTGMPEAGLARELNLRYASCCIVVNAAAGRGVGAIHAEIEQHLKAGMSSAAQLVGAWLQTL
jgi:5'-methylthioinosine phosphorylase